MAICRGGEQASGSCSVLKRRCVLVLLGKRGIFTNVLYYCTVSNYGVESNGDTERADHDVIHTSLLRPVFGVAVVLLLVCGERVKWMDI